MIYDWYKIINRLDFDALGLVSKEIEPIFDGIGQKKILLTKGNYYSITVEGVMLTIGLTGSNLFASDGFAVYLDSSQDIWLGFEAS